MEVLLDSNFIVSCIRKRIDFLSQLEEQGFRIMIPREVLQELKDLRLKVPHEERALIDLAFRMLEDKRVRKMKIGGENVDMGLIKKGKEGYYIATLDNAIKRIVPNRIVIFNAKNAVGADRE